MDISTLEYIHSILMDNADELETLKNDIDTEIVNEKNQDRLEWLKEKYKTVCASHLKACEVLKNFEEHSWK